MDDKKEKHYLTPINIFVLIISTIIIIFLIYISILLISRPPIFNVFGETGGFLPTSIPVIIAISVLVAIFLSFVLMVPSIPVGIKAELERKKSKTKTSSTKKQTKTSAVSATSGGIALLTQTSHPQSLMQQIPLTKISPM